MLLEALYFFLPAYFSNLVPPLFQWLSILNKPLDFNKTYKGKRLLGDNKTIRGFLLACIFGVLTIYVQKLLYTIPFFYEISIIDYSKISLWLGFLFGFGGILGDAVESFFKRQKGLESGKSWIPFDQLDYVFGALIFSSIIFIPKISLILILIIVSPFLHVIAHYTGYLIGINKDKL